MRSTKPRRWARRTLWLPQQGQVSSAAFPRFTIGTLSTIKGRNGSAFEKASLIGSKLKGSSVLDDCGIDAGSNS
jgi:hypothetical protein